MRAGQSAVWVLFVGDGQGDGLQGLRCAQAHERTAAAAAGPSAATPAALQEHQGLMAVSTAQTRCALLDFSLLGSPLSALVLLEVAAVDERVRGGEGAAGAAEGLPGGVFEALVQVEVVLALAAVAAAVAVEGPLARVHAHMLDQLVGRLGQVAALLAAVVVAQAVGARVPLQLRLAGPRRLADAAAVLRLAVRLQVALHGCRPVGGVDAERAPGSQKTRRKCKRGEHRKHRDEGEGHLISHGGSFDLFFFSKQKWIKGTQNIHTHTYTEWTKGEG